MHLIQVGTEARHFGPYGPELMLVEQIAVGLKPGLLLGFTGRRSYCGANQITCGWGMVLVFVVVSSIEDY